MHYHVRKALVIFSYCWHPLNIVRVREWRREREREREGEGGREREGEEDKERERPLKHSTLQDSDRTKKKEREGRGPWIVRTVPGMLVYFVISPSVNLIISKETKENNKKIKVIRGQLSNFVTLKLSSGNKLTTAFMKLLSKYLTIVLTTYLARVRKVVSGKKGDLTLYF